MGYQMKWGLYRMTVIIGGTIIGILGLVFGFFLVKSGATGEFAISMEVKGIKGFFTSISPGLLFAFMGCTVAAISYLVQLKVWAMPSEKQIKARGGIKYYELDKQLKQTKTPTLPNSG